MIIYMTIDTDNNSICAVDENQETTIDYSACDPAAISVEAIINDFLT